jgi:hypothetical protein
MNNRRKLRPFGLQGMPHALRALVAPVNQRCGILSVSCYYGMPVIVAVLVARPAVGVA